MNGDRSPRPDRLNRAESQATYTRRRVIVAGVVATLPLTFWLRSNGSSTGSTVAADPPAPTAATPPEQSVAPVHEPVPVGAEQFGAISSDLALGMVTDEVAALQQRLLDLRFDPGPVDGWFGESTLRSVWAFEKLVVGTPRAQATGVMTPEMWDQIREPVRIAPRRSTNGQADHTEIYLPEQVMVVFHRDVPVLVSHVASGELDENGDAAEWCELVSIDTDERGVALDEPVERDICGISKTPGGVFDYTRRVEGMRNGALGSMWNPVYFNYGIAVHGAINVPLAPASHGCVRIPMHIADYFQNLVADGDGVLVWDGAQQPEDVSERDKLPVFDYPNPNATTTTTTTVPATTAPPTVAAPTTDGAVSATTATSAP